MAFLNKFLVFCSSNYVVKAAGQLVLSEITTPQIIICAGREIVGLKIDCKCLHPSVFRFFRNKTFLKRALCAFRKKTS